MNKYLKCLIFIFIMCFAFNFRAKAIHCVYEHTDSNGKTKQFIVYNHAYGVQGYFWGDTSLTWLNHTLVYENKKQVSQTDTCTSYIFFEKTSSNQKQVYFSNNANIDKKYQVRYSLKTSYSGYTQSNAILEDMMCVYSMSPDGYQKGQPYQTVTFKINRNNYEIYGNWRKIVDGYNYNNSTDYQIVDNYDPRLFYDDETKVYGCPSGIYLGWESQDNAFAKISKIILAYEGGVKTYSGSWDGNKLKDLLLNKVSGMVYLPLKKDGSYIDAEVKSNAITGETCLFGVNATNKWYIGINAIKFEDGTIQYNATYNDETVKNKQYEIRFSFEKDYLFEDCSDSELSKIVTNCGDAKNKKSSCIISDRDMMIDKDSGNATTYESMTERNEKDITDAELGVGTHSGYNFKNYVCDLSIMLAKYNRINNSINFSKLPNLKFYNGYEESDTSSESYSINSLPCSSWGFTPNYDCSSSKCENASNDIKNQLNKIQKYCNARYSEIKTENNRKKECDSFYSFTRKLSDQGSITDIFSGCEIMSNQLYAKLKWLLDIIKIAGPILALGFGTLDFVKAIASGDADKEMKTSFKRFSNRIIAAVTLFIFPIILAFIMDIFLNNQEGYVSDNPFCGLVEFNK